MKKKVLGSVWLVVMPALFVVSAAAPAAAQVNQADIQRLQDQVYQASRDLSDLRGRDAATADRLQGPLDDLRDEVIYLKVKLRKEGNVSRAEYNDVRDRLSDLRAQARGEAPRQGTATFPGAPPPPQEPQQPPPSGYGQPPGAPPPYGGTTEQQVQRPGEIPAGQELDVRLERELSSETAQVEDRFRATTIVDLYQGNDVLIPAGSTLRGVVSSVNKASRTERRGSLTVAFDQITIRGRNYPIHATVTQAIQSEGIKGEAGKIGAGAGVGAIIGGILGGAKGALLGVLIGGGGTIAATEGTDVTLPAGSVLRVRFDEPLRVR